MEFKMKETTVLLDETETARIISALETNLEENQSLINKIKNSPLYNKLPDSIKEDNWKLFDQAESPDPSIAAQYAVKWITHLQITMEMAGITEFNPMLNRALEKARISLASYTDITDVQHEGKSLQEVSEVIRMAGYLMYDDRFSIRDKHGFTGR
jgi:hypothetical protein